MPPLIRPLPFLLTVAEARGRAPFDQGANPVEVDARIHQEFGPGFGLVWSLLAQKWMVVRRFPWDPDFLYVFDKPLTLQCIHDIRWVMDLTDNPAKKDLLLQSGQYDQIQRHRKKAEEFRDEIKGELKFLHRFRNAVTVPRRRLAI